ncbi:tripartite motif-containing protein 2-like [Ischnura elegans]|uniref:tripartite motif-containing protein 2-like n=1 Tax=Ischnura elegans TaxID=197161 RepID=UPI001ED89FC0|nr:tripartite motif-containing protein 2-like [Ischnura elegans]XP_046405542.1 tripartite motif-containing protein 2-like [Ischnura elegans]
MSMNSTLVETVSINYEDFNESFLTCGTCLCMYDGGEHTPKLLQCSHTVCLHCLSRIAASQTRDTGAFRCPICRELIPIPRGGVSALPPSFLVNQLLDLMSRQRREVVPKCSVHINQELLFCETCDTVFCTQCTNTSGGFSAGVHGASSSSNSGSCEHTVIPFSIAIKRMSEILLYKANECISKLGLAQEAVSDELRKLNTCAERCVEHANHTFDEVIRLAEERRQEVISSIRRVQESKRGVLEEQLALVEAEKNKVEHECDGLQYQVEVRNITQKISSLSEKLDSVGALGEPRENAFLACEFKLNGRSSADSHRFHGNTTVPAASEVAGERETSLSEIQSFLNSFGSVRTSTTFPGLCSLVLENQRPMMSSSLDSEAAAPMIARLEVIATLHTVDYHGIPRTTGGDPLTAKLVWNGNGENAVDATELQFDVRISDVGNGTYLIAFRPPYAGSYSLHVSVLDRAIRDCPLCFEATEHNNPVAVFGCRGSGKDGFHQPVAVAVDDTHDAVEGGLVYVVDAGNSRIKVLTTDLEFVRHIECEDLAGRSCTGVALVRKQENGKAANGKRSPCNLVLVNWRTKVISEITSDGETVRSFSYPSFVEPVAVAVDSRGHILVADNGTASVIAFDCEGKVLFVIGGKNSSDDNLEKVGPSRAHGAATSSRASHGRSGAAACGGGVSAGERSKGHFGLISSVAIGPADEIIVSDSRIQVFSSSGEYLREVEAHGRGKYGAATVDPGGRLLAIHSDKSRHELQVISLGKESECGRISRGVARDPLLSTVDSHGSRLRRPSAVAVTTDCHAFIVDLGNDCVKKYQYW